MRRILPFLLLSTSAFAQVQTLPPLPPVSTLAPPFVQKQEVDLQQFPLKNLLNLMFQEYRANYVLDPAINEDSRQVSLRWDVKKQKLESFLPTFLDMLGYELTIKNSIYYVSKKSSESAGWLKKVYLPKNRTSAFLVSQLTPFFPKSFPTQYVSGMTSPFEQKGSQSQQSNGQSSAPSYNASQFSDFVLFQGTQNEWTQVQALLKQLDVPERNVKISARLYEVNLTKKDATAFGALISLGNGVLNIGVGSTTPMANFIQLKNSVVNAVFSLIDSNSNFKLVSSPFLVVKNGQKGDFSAGQQVPILGAIITNANGQSQQSVEYKNTGVLFSVLPKIREQSVEITVNQTLSEVVSTTTGIASTPTIPNRSISTSLVMEPGNTIVIGGLRSEKKSDTDQGIFFLRDKSKDVVKSEVLLFLTVEKDLTTETESVIN